MDTHKKEDGINTCTTKILYVDDEPLLNMAFVETMKLHGYQARGALSGEECLEKIDADVPDIIVLDIMMKPMSGWDTLMKIKEKKELQTLSIIMQTGKSLTLRDVLTYGELIDDYLIKPVKLKDMIDAVERLVQRNKETGEEIKSGRSSGISEDVLMQYALLKRQVMVHDRLLEILSHIYPARENQDLDINIDLPDLKELHDTFEVVRERYVTMRSLIV